MLPLPPLIPFPAAEQVVPDVGVTFHEKLAVLPYVMDALAGVTLMTGADTFAEPTVTIFFSDTLPSEFFTLK